MSVKAPLPVTLMQTAATEDHFFKAWHLFGNFENDEITCHRNSALYCVALPGGQHEVRRVEISSLYSKHGLMDYAPVLTCLSLPPY